MNEAFYEAMIIETVYGPYSLMDLKRMAMNREIDETTAVRKVRENDWSTWGELEGKYRLYFYQQQQAAASTYAHLAPEKSDKSRGLYIILALLFGSLGLHNFYASRFNVGFAQFFSTIVLTVLGLVTGLIFLPLITAIWAIVDAVAVTEDGNDAIMT